MLELNHIIPPQSGMNTDIFLLQPGKVDIMIAAIWLPPGGKLIWCTGYPNDKTTHGPARVKKV